MKVTRLPYGMKTKGFIIVCDETEMETMISQAGRTNDAEVSGSHRVYQQLLGAKDLNGRPIRPIELAYSISIDHG